MSFVIYSEQSNVNNASKEFLTGLLWDTLWTETLPKQTSLRIMSSSLQFWDAASVAFFFQEFVK